MGIQPTRVAFDPDALTVDQLDGFACVSCGADLVTGIASVPVGIVDGGQVFACASHLDEQTDPNACVTCGRDFTVGRAVIPNVPVGRVAGVLMFACVTCAPADENAAALPARLLANIDRNADLADEFTNLGEVDLATAFADIAAGFRAVAEALATGGDVDAALEQTMEANARGRAVLAAARARTSGTAGGRS